MYSWLDFLNLIFLVSVFSFIQQRNSFLILFILSELIWVLVYTLVVALGGWSDNAILLSLSFYVLALAGGEFSLGFLLLLLFKAANLSDNLEISSVKSQVNIKPAAKVSTY